MGTLDSHECLPFYHPTTVLYVDDDGELLQMLPLKVGALPFRVFTDPQQLLSAMESGELLTDIDLRCWNRYTGEIGDPDTEGVIGLDKWMIYLRLFNRRRFDLVSVVVIDYKMPGMSGITLCERLARFPCKKIMLTETKDLNLAVQAFNDGLIDQFIPKRHPNMHAELRSAVSRLKARFFEETSHTVRELLVQDDRSLWTDRALCGLLRQHCADRGIAEHYAVSDPRGFLLIDTAGRGYLWLVFSDAEIDSHSLAARRLGAPSEIVARMEGRRSIVFVGDFEGNTVLDRDTWWRACLPLTPVPGRADLYYCITRDSAPFRVTRDSVLCYEDYLGHAA